MFCVALGPNSMLSSGIVCTGDRGTFYEIPPAPSLSRRHGINSWGLSEMSSKKNVMGRTREWGRVQKCQKNSFSSTLLAGMVWIPESWQDEEEGGNRRWSVKRNTPATKWWRGKKKLVGKDKYGSGKRSWLVKRNTGAGIKLPRVPSGDRGLLMSLLSVSTEHHSATLLQTCSTKYTLPFTNYNDCFDIRNWYPSLLYTFCIKYVVKCILCNETLL